MAKQQSTKEHDYVCSWVLCSDCMLSIVFYTNSVVIPHCTPKSCPEILIFDDISSALTNAPILMFLQRYRWRGVLRTNRRKRYRIGKSQMVKIPTTPIELQRILNMWMWWSADHGTHLSGLQHSLFRGKFIRKLGSRCIDQRGHVITL